MAAGEVLLPTFPSASSSSPPFSLRIEPIPISHSNPKMPIRSSSALLADSCSILFRSDRNYRIPTTSIPFLFCSFRPDPTRRISLPFRLFWLCSLRNYLTQVGLSLLGLVGCVLIRVGSNRPFRLILLASSATSSSSLPSETGRRRRRGNSGAASLFSYFWF